MQDADGKQRDAWAQCPIRVTDLTVTPDLSRLIAVGMYDTPPTLPGPTQIHPENGSAAVKSRTSESRMIIYDLSTKQPEW